MIKITFIFTIITNIHLHHKILLIIFVYFLGRTCRFFNQKQKTKSQINRNINYNINRTNKINKFFDFFIFGIKLKTYLRAFYISREEKTLPIDEKSTKFGLGSFTTDSCQTR